MLRGQLLAAVDQTSHTTECWDQHRFRRNTHSSHVSLVCDDLSTACIV